MSNSEVTAPAPAPRMSDIAGRLDADVQDSLRDAFRAIRAVSERLAIALEKRTALLEAMAAERISRN